MIKFSFKNFTLKRLMVVIVLIIIVIIGWRITSNKNQSEEESSIRIPKVSLLNVDDYKEDNAVVSVIGAVESVDQLELKSQLSAQTRRVNVKVGDEVKRGQVLAELDHAGLDAQLAQASATIQRMEANLNLRIAGATDEEIEQTKAAVEQSKKGLDQARSQMEATIIANDSMITNAEIALELAENDLENTSVSSEDSITNAYDNLRLSIDSGVASIHSSLTEMGNILGESPGDPSANDVYEPVLGAEDYLSINTAELQFNNALASYNSAKEKADLLSESSFTVDIENASAIARSALEDTLDALDAVRYVLDKTISTAYFSDTSLSGLKSAIAGEITSINGSLTGLTTYEQAISASQLGQDSASDATQLAYEKAVSDLETAKSTAEANLASIESAVAVQESALKQAEAMLDIILASPRDVDLNSLRAGVNEASAAYQLIASNRAKAIFAAPFDGTVASVPVRVGDLVAPGSLVVSLVNTDGYQITAYINEEKRKEIDISSPAAIEGGVNGEVFRIAPSIDPMTKKVELIITVTDENPNLTVGEYVDIEISKAQTAEVDVLYTLPLPAIKITPQGSYVFEVNDDSRLREHEVKQGRVVGELVEVLEGVTEGMQIVSSTRGLDNEQEVEVIE